VTDPQSIRWVSLGVVTGVAALAVWAFSDSRGKRSEQANTVTESGRVAARFEIRRPGTSAERVIVEDGSVLGRARDCAVPFGDAAVSKWHARLHCDGVVASIEDLGSTNGTFVNGQRIETPTPLRRGDRIGLGTNQIVFLGLARAGRATN
jgi:pSer/pThr/pTyr-binding forkhead associated (FHA) protein